MMLKKQMKSGFIQSLSYITLSIITTIAILPPTIAQQESAAKLACEESLNNTPQRQGNKQAQKIAQFSDSTQERSLLIQKANALYTDGNFPEAEQELCKFIKKYPTDAFGYFQLGNAFFRNKKPEAAISAYQESIRLKPEYALAYNAIGMVYASQSRWTEAIDQYNQALKINSDYADALTNVALVLWQTNKKDEALTTLQKALNIFKKQNRTEKVNQIEQILLRIKNSQEPNLS